MVIYFDFVNDCYIFHLYINTEKFLLYILKRNHQLCCFIISFCVKTPSSAFIYIYIYIYKCRRLKQYCLQLVI